MADQGLTGLFGAYASDDEAPSGSEGELAERPLLLVHTQQRD